MLLHRTFALLLLAAGCDQALGPGPRSGPQLNWGPGSNTLFEPPQDALMPAGIVGDWFPCQTPRCQFFSGEGVRFTEDGQVISLQTFTGSWAPGDSYCEAGVVGQYEILGDILVLEIEGQGLPFDYEIVDGDRLILDFMDQGAIEAQRADPPNSTGPCQFAVPDLPPTRGPGPGGP